MYYFDTLDAYLAWNKRGYTDVKLDCINCQIQRTAMNGYERNKRSITSPAKGDQFEMTYFRVPSVPCKALVGDCYVR